MAIFTAIGTAIAGALFAGSALAATIIGSAIAFGVQVAVGYLMRPKRRKYTAIQGEIQFGGDVPCGAIYGTSLVMGQRIYYAKYGKGNKYNAEVFVLSNGWCDGLEPEVIFYGKKHNLKLIGGARALDNWQDLAQYLPGITSQSAMNSYFNNWGQFQSVLQGAGIFMRGVLKLASEHVPQHFPGIGLPGFALNNAREVWTVEDFDDKITIRFYDGRPGQQADMALVADTADLDNPWLQTDTCTGMCYVVIEREYDEELFDQGRPEFGFTLRGLREYDPRRDSTKAGGDGPQRLDDSSTWEHTLNPAVHRLNYQLGLRGLISGRTIIGEGKSLGQLDLDSYIAAMNACDAIRDGKPTYQCSLYVNGDDDHTEVLREFDDAMAGYGMNRRGLSGVLVGAPQVPVMDIGPDDLDMGRAKQVRRRKSAFDLYNHFSGQFTSPESLWQPESLKPITVNTDVAADGRVRQVGNDFLQVTDADIAQYLLQIRYRQNRLGGSATLPVSRRAGFRVMEGDWVTYDGVTWLVTGWRCDENLEVTLTLAETSAAVYSSLGIEPGPIIVPPPVLVNPSLLSTVQNFNVEVGFVDGPDGYEVPALRFTWDPPEDPTIVAVRFEYFQGDDPTGQTICKDQTADAEAGEYLTTKDVAPFVHYTARATIRTIPDRLKTWTPWETTATATGPIEIWPPGLIEQIEEWVQEQIDWTDEGGPLYPLWQDIIQEGIDRANQIAAERNERVADVSVLAGRQRDLYETVRRTELSLTDTLLAQKRDLVLVREELVSVDQSSRAYAEDVFNLAVGPGSALAERLTTIEGTALSNYNNLSASITGVQSTLLDAIGGEASARAALRIQLVGEYTGNDIAQVTEGLLYQDRQAWISETQALSEAIDLISAGVGILFDWIDQWSFNTSVEGWTGNGTPTASGGWLRPANHATEPFVVSPDDLEMDGNAYRQIKLRIRKTGSPVWRGQFWWQGEADSTWDAGRRETVAEPSYVDGVAVVTVDMGWGDQIDRLRIDLSEAQTANDYFEIDWVSVGRPSPGASQAQVAAVQSALASQILAEAQSREDLSVILTGLADPTGATLPGLTQGLIYDERTARAAGDGANLLLIQGLAAQIEDPSTGLDALAQVQSTMSGTLSSLGGTVSGHTSLINDILLDIDDLDENKAGIGVTDGLQAQIDQLGGGQSLSLLASAVRSLRLTVDRMALGLPDVWLSGKRDMDELGGIVAQVHQEAISRIDITDEKVTLHGQIIDQINLNLADKAGLDIVNALTGRVEATEDGIVSQGGQILSIQSALNGYTGANAVATALSQRYTKTETDNEIDGATSALSGMIEAVEALVGTATAGFTFKAEAMASPGDSWVRAGLRLSANDGVTFETAALLMDARTSGSVRSRVGAIAGQFFVMDPDGMFDPFVVEAGIARFNEGRVRNLTTDNLKANDVNADRLKAGTLDVSKWAPPTAGDNVIHDFTGEFPLPTFRNEWPTINALPSWLGPVTTEYRAIGFTVRVGGTIRLKLRHGITHDDDTPTGTSYVRVYSNGSQIQEWSHTGDYWSSPAHRTLDIAVTAGDNITIQHRHSALNAMLSALGEVRVCSGNITPAVY